MPDVLYAIDTSYDDVTYDKARAVREAGVELALQCLYDGVKQPAHRVTNLRNYANAGLLIAGYASLPTNASVGCTHMDVAHDGVPPDLWAALVRCAVDVELDGITTYAVRQAVARLAQHGKTGLIYTNLNTWVHKLGDPHDFTDCQLWNAWWDEDPDRDFDAHPYGGWRPNQVIAEQYSGGHQVAGVYADRDVFYLTRAQLLGQPTAAIVDAATGLLTLRIAILERGIDATRAGDPRALRQLADFIGATP
jgi:hypothetical protein